MDKVDFVTVEDNGTDLVLGLSFLEGTEFGVDGFIMQRTPSMEGLLDPSERGAMVDWTDDDECVLVRSVVLNRQKIRIVTTANSHEFDLAEIRDDEFKATKKILKKLNFDSAFSLQFA